MLRLGRLLAQLREKKGLTAYRVAQLVGVTPTTLYQAEASSCYGRWLSFTGRMPRIWRRCLRWLTCRTMRSLG
jgi:hypothetical protein